MENSFPAIDKVLSPADISVAGEFSGHVNHQVFIDVQELVISFVDDFARSNDISFRPGMIWLDEGWEIISLDASRFRVGVFLDHSTSSLQIIVDDYIKTQGTRTRRAIGKVGRPGQIRGVQVCITPTLELDQESLCEKIVDKVDEIYKFALIDYKSALRDYCLASASDELYDVLRKSQIPEIIQKEITLYCVFEAMGRHIPSLDRINEIIKRLHTNTPGMDVCPLRLATDFFLTPLDGRHNELYTQQAFREGQAIVGPGNKASGESYIRLASEAFFRCSEVIIQPIASAGDAWLLSAIYPSRLVCWILPEIEKEKLNFKQAIDKIQMKHRDLMNKLKQLMANRSVGEKSRAALAGEFLGGIIKAFTS